MSKAARSLLCSSSLVLGVALSTAASAERGGPPATSSAGASSAQTPGALSSAGALSTGARITPTRDAATAEALFRQGRQALDAGRFQDACPKFAESQRLDPAAGTLMNLATCEEKLGKLASAWQHWREAIDLLPGNDDRIPFAQSRVTALETKLPRLIVKVAGPVEPTSKVLRDETEIGTAGQGVPLPVDPGPHVVTLRTPGRFDGTVTVAVAEGERKEAVVQMGAIDPVATAQLAEQQSGGRSSTRPLGWALGAVGVAGLGGAIATGLVVRSSKATVDRECPQKANCSQEGLAATTQGKTFLILNTISWVVAAAGIGAGTYFILSSSPSQPTAVLAPTFSPTGAALSCEGTF